jgi:hypothetical protein
MRPLKILLIIVGFFGIAVLVFFAGSLLADCLFEYAFRQAATPANAAGFLAPMFFFTKFIVVPIVSIAAGAFTAWKIAKSDLAF